MSNYITKKLRTSLFLAFLLAAALHASTLRVPAEYSTIQSAIDSAGSGDTVLVSPGTYVENIDFHGQQVVVGSFFLTSGDTSYISQTIIDGNRDSSVVSFQNQERAGTQLTGFSIRNGLGTGDWPYVRGGGIHFSYNTSPLISYCYIHDNESVGQSNRGAGIYTSNGKPTIKNCRIYNNTSFVASALCIGNGGNGVLIDSCAIYNNSGYSTVLISYSSNITVSHCVIFNNDGVGLNTSSTNNTQITNCTIVANAAAGISHSGVNASVRDTVYLTNSIVYANQDSNEVPIDSLFIARYSILDKASNQNWFDGSCLDSDPVFADSTYHLSESSPAINAGDPDSPPDPDGTIADIGAYYYQQTTSLEKNHAFRVSNFKLLQNYPNPFNPSTLMRFSLKRQSHVRLTIYDALGRKISTLMDEFLTAGSHQIKWNAEGFASGVYLYRLESGQLKQTRRMVLIR